MNFKKLFILNWPILILTTVVLIIFWRNYIPDTYLTGWDNLHPEFNFGVNLKRSIFAVWQEYQGLGLLGGMAHAADLVHQLLLFFFSLFMPLNLLRYFWTILMLLIGSLGTYFLLKELILKELNITKSTNLIPFLGGLFYLLNLNTVQTFYAPFEAFVAHFAFLPWLILTAILYWKTPIKKNLILLSIVLILASPSAYLQTLYVVFLITLSILVLTLFIFKKTKTSFINTIKLYAIVFIVNAFWLLPFLHFTLTSSQVNLTSKINQMSTETIFLQNKEFGNVLDVVQLKGFWFNNVDPNLKGDFNYMLLPWKQHFQNPLINSIGYFFFLIIIIGLIFSFKQRKQISTAFLVLFAFSFTMLATTTPPFSFFNTLFRQIPLFDQAFRFPFTKFGNLTALLYAIFFAIGVSFIMGIFKKIPIRIIGFILICLLIIFIFPIFKGNLFYNKERLIIPKEYFSLFNYFKNQNQNTRIANLPQPNFWGWAFYNWGYGGSGFPWYGIKQPILDRAFDVWSKTDENYYFELSNAIYSRNPVLFEAVLNKYQINYLFIDKNIIYPTSPQGLFISELQHLINQTPMIKKDTVFGKIDIYKVDLKDKPENFVFLNENLPQLNSYNWTDLDQAYLNNGNYIGNEKLVMGNGELNYFYPFRSLFSLKSQNEREYSIKEDSDYIYISNKLPNSNSNNVSITLPNLIDKENIIPIKITTQKDKNNHVVISAILIQPDIFIDGQKISGKTFEQKLFDVNNIDSLPVSININGVANFTIDKADSALIGTTFLTLKQDNVINLTIKKTGKPQNIKIPLNYLKSLPIFKEEKVKLENIKPSSSLTLRIPKIKDNYLGIEINPTSYVRAQNCDWFRKGKVALTTEINNKKGKLDIYSKNATLCLAYYLPTLIHQQGYLLLAESANLNSNPLQMWILNEDEKYTFINTYFEKKKNFYTHQFIVSPMESFGKSYSLHFNNTSIGEEETKNILGRLGLYYIPYNFTIALEIKNETKPFKLDKNIKKDYSNFLEVSHPNESLYVINSRENLSGKTLILSQSFDPGWKAYDIKLKTQNSKVKSFLISYFPFLFGEELKDHVLVNNWENGWKINDLTAKQSFDSTQDKSINGTIVIVYLPQYLEYFGFLLLILYLGYLVIPGRFGKRN